MDLFTTLKQKFPEKNDQDLQNGILEIKKADPQASDDDIVNTLTQIKSDMDSGAFHKNVVRDQVSQKNAIGKYAPENRQKIVDENAKDASGPNWLAGLGALGAGLQGGNATAAGQAIINQQQNSRDSRLKEFDQGRDLERGEMLAAREDEKYSRDQKLASDNSDPNSERSKVAQKILIDDFGMSPEMASKMSADQVEARVPTLKLKLDREMKTAEFQDKRADRRDAMEDRAYARNESSELKREAAKLKEQTLSPAQEKARGLYNSGALAESQFRQAMNDGKSGLDQYDPTSRLQFLDNSEWTPNILRSDKAIESDAAQSAWVESYLRDASGAAINSGERMDYAKDFFPRKGDSPQVVANKEKLRMQKMENARLAAGGDKKGIDRVAFENSSDSGSGGLISDAHAGDEVEQAKASQSRQARIAEIRAKQGRK